MTPKNKGKINDFLRGGVECVKFIVKASKMKKIVLGFVLTCYYVFGNSGLTASKQDIELLEEVCQSGDTEICGGVGEIYHLGLYNVKKDFNKALNFYTIACNGGYVASCSNLANMYAIGLGVKQDYKKAIELFDKACLGGLALGCSNLGNMYYNGRGVKKDIEKGIAYLEKACSAGDFLGCNNLAAYNENIGDIMKAKKYIKMACDIGREDYDVQNIPESRELWENACRASNLLK